jgi:hypothetical protein
MAQGRANAVTPLEDQAVADVTNVNQIQRKLIGLNRLARTCEATAQALIGTQRPWLSTNVLRLFVLPTEYERLRGRVMSECRDLCMAVARIRRRTGNPEWIRLHHDLTRMLQLCPRCSRVNGQRLSRRAPFVCLLRENEPPDVTGGFRYRLDERGQLVEH